MNRTNCYKGTDKEWTDQMIYNLLCHREDGVEFSRIADRLGKSRDACIGMFHRVKHELERSEL